MTKRKYVLAIESAVRGGSLALLVDGVELSGFDFDADVSRSEDLLPNIEALLAKAGLGRHDLARVAVSRGPGSFTGLRIGMATAIGLSRSLKLPCSGVPLFPAIATCFPGPTVIALPLGKHDVACSVSNDMASRSLVVSRAEIPQFVEDHSNYGIIVHHDLYDEAASNTSRRVTDAGSNMARFIGLYPHDPNATDLAPIYLPNPAKSTNLF